MTNLVAQLADSAKDFGVQAAYGDPIDVNGSTIIPVAIVWYGFGGGSIASPIPGLANPGSTRRPHINTWTDELGTGAVIALDPRTGDQKWKFKTYDVNTSGILTTASDVLFVGGREGYFHALDARTGTVLWKTSVGWHTTAAPITYELAGKQYVAIGAGRCLLVYGLRE